MKKPNPSSIPKTLIFTTTKNIACRVYSFLSSAAANRQYIGMYHASLTNETKQQLRLEFAGQTTLRCLVATIAFGMVSDLSQPMPQ